jgi:transcriptional regulator with XRE-family HTH domain
MIPMGNAMGRERFSDQIRAAVDGSGMSRYAICKAIGMTQGSMSRFMNGKGGLSLDAIDKLAELLRLDVVRRPRRSR